MRFRALDLPRSSLRYTPLRGPASDGSRIEELADTHRIRLPAIWALLDREGWSVNKKAVRRICACRG